MCPARGIAPVVRAGSADDFNADGDDLAAFLFFKYGKRLRGNSRFAQAT
jgi:hypothetical protein